MSKKRSGTFRFYVGLLAFLIFIYLSLFLIDFWWDHADYVFEVMGVNTMSPWTWIVIGVFFIWGARFERRMYLKLQEESRALNKLQASRVAFTLGLGLAALLIGLVMLLYR